ncbi:MAG: HAD family hydrolase [Asgard group archaeon]|nr:HAD family hydrolase [Asgard group archaeon]
MNDTSSWNNYCILFDMDGVLISLKARWIDPVEQIIEKIHPDFDRNKIAQHAPSLMLIHGGRSANIMFKGILEICKIGGLSKFQTFRVLVRLFFSILSKKKWPIVPFEGTFVTLKQLREMDFNLALITSASRYTLRRVKREYPSIYGAFDCIVTRNDVRFTKPSPEQILIALEKLSIQNENSVVVGDFMSDIQAGKNVGTKTIGVLSEFTEISQSYIESTNPDLIVSSITEIPTLLPKVFSV